MGNATGEKPRGWNWVDIVKLTYSATLSIYYHPGDILPKRRLNYRKIQGLERFSCVTLI